MSLITIRDYDEIIARTGDLKANLYVESDKTAGSRENLTIYAKWNRFTHFGGNDWNEFKVDGEWNIELPVNVRVGGVISPIYRFYQPSERWGNEDSGYKHDAMGDNTAESATQFYVKYINNGSINIIDINSINRTGVYYNYRPIYPNKVIDESGTYNENMWIFPPVGNDYPDTQTIKIKVNIPLFKTNEDLEDYLRTGNLDNAISDNYDPEDLGGVSDVYYWDYADCTIGDGHKIIAKSDESSCKLKLMNKDDLIAWVTTDTPNQRTLECSNTYVFVLSGTEYVKTRFSDISIAVYDGNHDINKYGDLYTNIPKGETLSDANNIEPTENSFNGEDAEMDLTNVTIAAAFCHAYYVDGSELSNISKVLYADNVDIETALLKGLWMYGENPINCIIDLCYYPFDLSHFISNHINGPLKFGSYYYNGVIEGVPAVDYYIIRATNTPFTMVNQRIIPIYNDFRDYGTVSYSIFLPYYGIIPLPEEVVGKNLTIKVYFDVYTSQMKYYLYCNNTLLTVTECTVGRHISVMGSSWLTKSGTNNINDFVSTYKSAMNMVSNIASGDAVGTISSLLDGAQSFMSALKKPDTTRTGSTTSGMNIYDPMSIYLITEQFETIKPAKLNSDYGKPVYKIDVISSVSGYVVVNNPKLKTHATSDENSEIIELLAKGIII